MTNCAECEPTDAEMNAAQEALGCWQKPEGFGSKVDALDSRVKSATLFNKANAGFLREAIPIAAFAKHRNVQSVRLVPQRECLNDGQFRSADEIIDIEVTEVVEAGRRRGDEYRSGIRLQTVADFDPSLGDTVVSGLATAIKNKAEKGYPTKPLLLVYLNIMTGGRLGDEIEIGVAKLRAEYAAQFREICVLWGTKWL